MKWIISNHKEALHQDNLKTYIEELNNLKTDNIKLVICPSNKHLSYFTNDNYILGSQDINNNVSDLKKHLVKYTIVGHSDRRKNNKETDEEINEKIKELLNNNICPILCIGEEKCSDIKAVLKEELDKALKNIKGNIIVAYEPIWAINSGIIPKVDELSEIIDYIEVETTKILGKRPIILYGGSVNEKTIKELEQVKSLDGYLIGNASLKISNIKRIIDIINE